MIKTTTATERVMRRAMGTVAVVALLAGTTLIAPQSDGGIGFQGHPVFAAPGGNGTFDPSDDGDTEAPDEGRDS